MTSAELTFCLDYFIKAGLLAGIVTGWTLMGLRIAWRPIT